MPPSHYCLVSVFQMLDLEPEIDAYDRMGACMPDVIVARGLQHAAFFRRDPDAISRRRHRACYRSSLHLDTKKYVAASRAAALQAGARQVQYITQLRVILHATSNLQRLMSTSRLSWLCGEITSDSSTSKRKVLIFCDTATATAPQLAHAHCQSQEFAAYSPNRPWALGLLLAPPTPGRSSSTLPLRRDA